MAQYKQSEITNVFWASNDGFKGGRDPLGIQNSSIATYSKLLPGLTNLTRHIRYYSLYCWLLSEYDKFEVAGQTSLHQYNFIRRAELAMALIMKEQNVGSVVGALFVSQGRYKQIEDGILILQMVLIMNLKISTGHSKVELLASTILVLLFIMNL